jgi:phosphoesterase RecJ-like protein
MPYTQAVQALKLIEEATSVVIVQADNPDSDSLGSALAFEQILLTLNKPSFLYCSSDMPSYLHYLEGWDRVEKSLPNNFDLSVIVDASTSSLLEKLEHQQQIKKLKAQPCLVIDHHEVVENQINFATVLINDFKSSSTGEVIYNLAKQTNLHLNNQALINIMAAILGDTQGLSNQLASSQTYKIMAEMLDLGISRAELEEKRRQWSKMPETIYRYKAELIKRTELDLKSKSAVVVIPYKEITEFSPLYNPVALIQNDMLQITDIEVAIVLKTYPEGKITGAIRSNLNYPVAGQLADKFGGGGHSNASGFKIDNCGNLADLKHRLIIELGNLIN